MRLFVRAEETPRACSRSLTEILMRGMTLTRRRAAPLCADRSRRCTIKRECETSHSVYKYAGLLAVSLSYRCVLTAASREACVEGDTWAFDILAQNQAPAVVVQPKLFHFLKVSMQKTLAWFVLKESKLSILKLETWKFLKRAIFTPFLKLFLKNVWKQNEEID